MADLPKIIDVFDPKVQQAFATAVRKEGIKGDISIKYSEDGNPFLHVRDAGITKVRSVTLYPDGSIYASRDQGAFGGILPRIPRSYLGARMGNALNTSKGTSYNFANHAIENNILNTPADHETLKTAVTVAGAVKPYVKAVKDNSKSQAVPQAAPLASQLAPPV